MNTPNLPFQTNRLLAALPLSDLQRLLPALEVVSLEIKDGLYEPDEPIEYVYFPLSGMVSILVVMKDGTFIETGIVGNEGMVGLPVFLGAVTTPTKAFCQIAGEVVRMRSDQFRAELAHNGTLVAVLQRYSLAYLALLAQNSACNAQHSIHQRCARWLLLTHDRVGNDQFILTQEFLSQMLAVRRAGVSEVMHALQKTGVLRYHRGMITIMDRAGFEQTACECYGMIAGQYAQMLA